MLGFFSRQRGKLSVEQLIKITKWKKFNSFWIDNYMCTYTTIFGFIVIEFSRTHFVFAIGFRNL